jgi:hypothetical protein
MGALASGAVAWFLEKRRLKWETERSRERITVALDAELEFLFQGAIAALKEADSDPLASMTHIATLRPLMSVFLGNTDKLGLLEADLAHDIIGAYQIMHHLIDRGHEMWQEVERELDPSLRHAKMQRERGDAADYVPTLKAWVKGIPSLRKRLMGSASARVPATPPSRA